MRVEQLFVTIYVGGLGFDQFEQRIRREKIQSQRQRMYGIWIYFSENRQIYYYRWCTLRA